MKLREELKTGKVDLGNYSVADCTICIKAIEQEIDEHLKFIEKYKDDPDYINICATKAKLLAKLYDEYSLVGSQSVFNTKDFRK